MWLPRWIYPQDLIYEHQIEQLFINITILVKICKGTYGLPQAGRLAYIGIIKHLKLHGYNRAGFTPGLFKHVTQYTMFCFVVDDFRVKYISKNDAYHFIDTLKNITPALILVGVAEFSLVFT